MPARLDAMRSACKNTSEADNWNRITKSRVVVDTRHRLIYSPISKSGTRTVTQFFREINGLPARDREYRMENLHFAHDLFYASMTSDMVNKEFGNYTAFTVVRHPLQRLVSVYFDFVVDAEWKSFVKARTDIQKNITISEWFNKTYHVAEFGRFVINRISRELRVKKDPRKVNLHWREYIYDLQPCHIRYDYIFKVETLNSDLKDLLEILKMKSSSFHEHGHGAAYSGVKSSNGNSLIGYDALYQEYDDYLRAFQIQNPEDFSTCLTYYRPSMRMFGYSWDSDKGRSICQCGQSHCC